LEYPERIHLELTTHCNLNCIYCSNKYLKKIHMYPVVADIALNVLIPNCKEIELQGTGESLLYPDFKKVISYADRYNCNKVIISNGMRLDKKILNYLINTNSQIVISIDGANEQTYQIHRPKGDFNRIIANLSNWEKIISQKKNNNASLIIHMTLTKYNLLQIPEMLKMIKRMKLDGLYVSTVKIGKNPLKIWDEISLNSFHDEINDQMHISKELAKELGLIFGSSFLSLKKKNVSSNIRAFCPAPWKHLYITATGDVFPCCQFKESMGNISNNTFEEVWEGKKFITFRNSFSKGIISNECKECILPWCL